MNEFETVFDCFSELGEDGAIAHLKNLGIDAAVIEGDDDCLYMLNYSQIDSPKTNPLVCMCRSLIVNRKGETVSRKFNRFFNHGEAPEITSKVNVINSVCQFKEDGSIIGIWWNPLSDRWDISTRKRALGDAPFEKSDGTVTTFRDMVLETLGVTEEEFQVHMRGFDQNKTLVFEWCHPENRIVTKYDKPTMYALVLSEHNNSYEDLTRCFNGVEMRYLQHVFRNVEEVKTWTNSKSIDSLVEYVNGLQDLAEGLVIWDPVTNVRVKMKAKTYVIAHRIRGEFKIPRDKDLCELIRTGEVSEFVAYFPEWEDRITKIENVIECHLKDLNEIYSDINTISDQKEFALEVMKRAPKNSGLFFGARKLNLPNLNYSFYNLSESKFYDFYTGALSD